MIKIIGIVTLIIGIIGIVLGVYFITETTLAGLVLVNFFNGFLCFSFGTFFIGLFLLIKSGITYIEKKSKKKMIKNFAVFLISSSLLMIALSFIIKYFVI